MSSASLISSNVSSSGNIVQVTSTTSMADPNLCGEGPLGQALQVLEKKVRNLEKRKGKLDVYRADYKRGKTLNDDQKAAIAKYDEVFQTLEFARELSTQFKTLSLEEEKTRKKQIKNELRERNKAEIERIVATIEIQEKLKWILTKKSEAASAIGENGSVYKLSNEEIELLGELEKQITPSRQQHTTKEEYEKSLKKCADHIACIEEGKDKICFGNTTYKHLKIILDKVEYVPERICIGGQDKGAGDSQVSATSIRGESLTENEKHTSLKMQVPNRILVADDNSHAGAKTLPRELQLENSVQFSFLQNSTFSP